MLRKILIGIALLVLALLVLIALQPSELRVTRTASIAAPPAVVFARVDDFRNWQAWSPWAKRDPAMKQTYEGAASGTGAVYTWAGNAEVGEGRMTITESRPGELVRIRLEFLAPLAATNTAEFTFVPAGSQTAVTWTMTGEQSFVGKAISLVLDMDEMIGGDFESGLAGIKRVSESFGRQPRSDRNGDERRSSPDEPEIPPAGRDA